MTPRIIELLGRSGVRRLAEACGMSDNGMREAIAREDGRIKLILDLIDSDERDAALARLMGADEDEARRVKRAALVEKLLRV